MKYFILFVESLFDCMLPMRRKTKKKTTGASDEPCRPPVSKTVLKLRREKMKRMCDLKTSCSYRQNKDIILGRITFQYENVVVVWCDGNYVPPSRTICRLLHSLGEVSVMRDRWHFNENNFEISWHGVFVEYCTNIEAMQSSIHIQVQVMYLRATMLETVITQLADCELLHPLCHQIPSKVVISKRIPLEAEDVTDLRCYLRTYGAIKSFYVKNRISSPGQVYEVTYFYLTQAYLAMIMTDGQHFGGGVLTATLEMTKKDTEILKDIKECMFLLSLGSFPS